MKKKFLKINLSKLINVVDYFLLPIKFIFIKFYLIQKKPFSTGYNFYKWNRILKQINKNKIDINIENAEGLDERIVEYPWVINELKKLNGNLLDAGSTINFPEILNKIKKKFSITIQTLYPENYCNFEDGISYLYSDLTKQTFKKNHFDVITCISTLEHVGFNVNIYKNSNNKKKVDLNNNLYLNVIKNFKIILKKNGVLLLTLPYGKHEKFKHLQQFDKNMIDSIIKIFNPKKYDKKFSVYKDFKWQNCSELDCKNINFRNFSKKKSYDNAASARSIIMLKLINN